LYKISSAELERVCGITSKLPENRQMEAAFAGKSNVGKSSLINSLMMRKALARTSSQPGKTATINYYHVNAGEAGREDFAPDVYLVDLPGYGYAVRSKEEIKKWGGMIENYLHTSGQLRAVFLLLDVRHAPSENDVMMYNWIEENGLVPVLIATKADKVKKNELTRNLNQIRTKLRVSADVRLIPFSAKTGSGRDDIWDVIKEMKSKEG
jgi:GTP-binding protein